MQTDIASISTKGQFVIPRPFRDILKLTTGSKMVIMCDGKHLLLKVPVTLAEAVLGAKIDVPTPKGTVSPSAISS